MTRVLMKEIAVTGTGLIIGVSVAIIIILIARKKLLKPKIITTSIQTVQHPEAEIRIDKDESMTYRQSANVALILTVAQIFTTFLTFYDLDQISIYPNAFIFDLIKFIGSTFFSIFIVISGMARYLPE